MHHVINFLFRLFLTFNATSLILVVYLVKEKKTLNTRLPFMANASPMVSYAMYIFIPIFLTLLSLLFSRLLLNDSIEAQNGTSAVKAVEQANNAYLPSYLGYFFVSLSVPEGHTMIVVFAILFVFTFLSQTLYFNPLFLIFGFHFYYVTTAQNVKIFLITRRVLRNPQLLSFPFLKRINDFTFIDQQHPHQ